MPDQRIAFLILAHQDPAQLVRLCRRLAGHTIFIHVDARNTGFPIQELKTLRGVVLIPRVPVFWGDFSVVEATLRLLRAAQAQGPFDRYVLLSGACYPARPIEELQQAFADNPQREWISLTAITDGSHLQFLIGRRWRMTPLVRNRAIDTTLRSLWNKVSKLIGRNLASEIGVTPYFGNQFWSLTNACVKYVLSYVETHPEYVRAYRSVYAPDEHFFHTLVGNSNFKDHADTVPDHGAGTNLMAPLHTIAVNDSRTFVTDADVAPARAAGSFFIRKVNSRQSAPLLDRIDAGMK